AVERALGSASRVLPFVLLTHAHSVANNVYWPEMYTNIPLVRGSDTVENPYAREGWSANADFDMEPPYNFGNTSPLDPVLVYKVNEFAEDVLQGRRTGRLSPMEIAERMDALADEAERALAEAVANVPDTTDPDFRRLAADIRIQAGTGRFFARKFRAALAYCLYEKNGSGTLLAEAASLYRSAREAWTGVVEASEGVYKNDITFGYPPYTRGHWADRIADIDVDLAAVEALAAQHPAGEGDTRTLAEWLAPLTRGPRPELRHLVPAGYAKGQPVEIRADIADGGSARQVWLHYRHVDQSDIYRTVKMTKANTSYTATIDGEYTDSPYPLQYFFEIRTEAGDAWMVPGYAQDLSNQPYYVIQAGK
ncbi:MAG: hypothetical protein GX153_08595, partial [Clostridiaceae bacterium]|nr:hypothetical protein [Clostridiaceae bacterium]